MTSLFFIIFTRLFYVQVVWGEDLQLKALDQWTREIPVIASRGKILDRNGVVLADNKDTYTVFVRKKAVKDMDLLCSELAKILELEEEFVKKRLTETKSSEVTVKKQVDKEKIDKLSSFSFSGVYYSRDNFRVYPYNDLLSSVLGFTASDGSGQAGLELFYDKYLKGKDGEILYETDIVGVELEDKPPTFLSAIDGFNIKLTIDYSVQALCESAMEKAYQMHGAKQTAMLVLDPKSGEILGVSARPSQNLNEIDRNNLDELFKNTRNTLFCDVYEPGSTFKILTSVANIEEHLKGNKSAYSINHVYNSSRYRYVDGQRVKCWSNHSNGKHSCLDLQGALNNSCNPIFVDIATSLGKSTMYKYIDLFNYGEVTGVDFNGEAQGMVLPESSIQNVDLARIAFGQTIAVTGLQLATATASAINGGYYYTPYLVKEIYSSNGSLLESIKPKLKNKTVSEKASKILNEMLEKVVSEGSGKHAYIDGFRVAGKTGTAQKYEEGRIAQGKYVSSFVGYFPANDPKYLALVIIDEPIGEYYGSTVAAPYAREVFEGIIKLKNLKKVI